MLHYKAAIDRGLRAWAPPARGPRRRVPARAEPDHQGWRASAAPHHLKAAPSWRPTSTIRFTRQRHSKLVPNPDREWTCKSKAWG